MRLIKFNLRLWLQAFLLMLVIYTGLIFFMVGEVAIEPKDLIIMFSFSLVYIAAASNMKPRTKPINKFVTITLVVIVTSLIYLQLSGVVPDYAFNRSTTKLAPQGQPPRPASVEKSLAADIIPLGGTGSQPDPTAHQSSAPQDLHSGEEYRDSEKVRTASDGWEKNPDSDVKESPEPEVSAEKRAQIEKYFVDIFSSIRAKNWEALIEQTKQSGIEELESDIMLTFALTQAITNGAPFEVLSTLIDEGAQFTPEVLFAAAIRQDVQVLNALVEYGLNLHMRDSEERTALYYSLFDLQQRAMFDYLLSKGVNPHISTPEHDLISRILESCGSTVDATYHLERLLSLGVTIQPYHGAKFFELLMNKSRCVGSIKPYFERY